MSDEKNTQEQEEGTESTETPTDNSAAQPAEGDPDAGNTSGVPTATPAEG